MINLRILFVLLLMLVCTPSVVTAQTTKEDTLSTHLLNEVKKYFNSDNETAFYQASAQYREYYLNRNDLNNYYQGWEHEILYDVNHNHFYRAMRKTMDIQRDMQQRKAEKQYYKATQLRGLIFSLRGNIPLARQYFEKALNEVDHSQPGNLVGLYMDLANIEMDTEPQEAMKHLNCAIEIIKAQGAQYEYSDAIGFKTIIAYTMRDWVAVRKAYAEYMQLKERLGNDFSMTYYNYVHICKYAADGKYDEALKFTNKLTNTTDIYKFQTEVYELSGDVKKAYEMQKKYMAVKDSVNNVIMSEEMIGSANDLEHAELVKEECSKRNEYLSWGILGVAVLVALMGYAACRLRKRKYMKQLKQQNRELLIARDKAQEAERTKISFLQNMSHEIRTPLNVISGYAQIISDPKTLMSETERSDMASRITHSTQNIVRIVEEILDISGKESINYIDKGDTISCNEVVKNVIECYTNKPENVRIHFDTNLKDSYKILTNRQEVLKILKQLLDNALKFTKEGTITLRCYQDELEQMVCFSVEDTGCGIKEGEEEKIFEHFYKVDAYKEGVGLGLPLARRVAHQLGGNLSLDSSYTGGSRFILKLPKE